MYRRKTLPRVRSIVEDDCGRYSEASSAPAEYPKFIKTTDKFENNNNNNNKYNNNNLDIDFGMDSSDIQESSEIISDNFKNIKLENNSSFYNRFEEGKTIFENKNNLPVSSFDKDSLLSTRNTSPSDWNNELKYNYSKLKNNNNLESMNEINDSKSIIRIGSSPTSSFHFEDFRPYRSLEPLNVVSGSPPNKIKNNLFNKQKSCSMPCSPKSHTGSKSLRNSEAKKLRDIFASKMQRCRQSYAEYRDLLIPRNQNLIKSHEEQERRHAEAAQRLRQLESDTFLKNKIEELGELYRFSPEISKRIKTVSESEVAFIYQLSHLPPNQIVSTIANIDVTGKDIATLNPGEWLNDEIINAYLELLNIRNASRLSQFNQSQINIKLSNQDDISTTLNRLSAAPWKCYAWSTFFFTKLSTSEHPSSSNKQSANSTERLDGLPPSIRESSIDLVYSYEPVRRWSTRRKLKVFELDIMFVPVHIKMVHWALGVVDFKSKLVFMFDSLDSNFGPIFFQYILMYLRDEHRDKNGVPIDLTDWMFAGGNFNVSSLVSNCSSEIRTFLANHNICARASLVLPPSELNSRSDNIEEIDNKIIQSPQHIILSPLPVISAYQEYREFSIAFQHSRFTPQQSNGSDCGVFTCQFAEALEAKIWPWDFDQSDIPLRRQLMAVDITIRKVAS